VDVRALMTKFSGGNIEKESKFGRRKDRLRLSSEHFEKLISNQKFHDMIKKFALNFDKNLQAFLKDLVLRRSVTAHRLDYNHYYSEIYDMQVSAPPLGRVASSVD